MVVCPTTLTYNWSAEAEKFFPPDVISVGIVETSKDNVQELYQRCNLLVVSYERVRRDIESLRQLDFFFVVLDEAHIIKNSKASVTEAVKSLSAERKLVLTGTPLQNRVVELWSLFDFLMPGFLEDEREFRRNYARFLNGSLKKLSNSLEEGERFINSVRSLKTRIAPFVLRRTKEDVLKELPPKTI